MTQQQVLWMQQTTPTCAVCGKRSKKNVFLRGMTWVCAKHWRKT
jgi:hypothetical protein